MRVLIASDSDEARGLVADFVRKLGHDPIEADDGERAWALFDGERADIVIADHELPEIDGEALCRRVRESESSYAYFPYAYLILVVATADTATAEHAVETGADGYLTHPLEPHEIEIGLVNAERVVGLHRKLDSQQQELQRVTGELDERSRLDPLTEVANRLALREDLDALEDRLERYGHKYALALCDIDNFSAYNDEHGHEAGDKVLRKVAGALAGSSRASDAVYRYGGEELIVVLPEQDLSGAGIAAERLRAGVEALQIGHPDNAPAGVVTISVGIAVGRSGADGGADATLTGADHALHVAKRQGRNRVSSESDGA